MSEMIAHVDVTKPIQLFPLFGVLTDYREALFGLSKDIEDLDFIIRHFMVKHFKANKPEEMEQIEDVLKRADRTLKWAKIR